MNTQQLALLLMQSGALGAVVMPHLVAMVIRVGWPTPLKAAVAWGSSLIVGALTAWVEGSLTGLSAPSRLQLALVCAGIVAGAAHKSYVSVWKPTGIGDAIERAINPGPLPDTARDALHRAVTAGLISVDDARRRLAPAGFYEEDEPVADVRAAFDAGQHRLTTRPTTGGETP